MNRFGIKPSCKVVTGPRYNGIDLLLERHVSMRDPGTVSAVFPSPNSRRVDWALLAILGFVAFAFAALGLAAYLIWLKTRIPAF